MGVGSERNEVWNRFADTGRAALVGTALLQPFCADAKWSRIGAAASLASTEMISKSLKAAISEQRPNREDNNSFPSQHAAGCVAAALIIQRQYKGSVGAAALMLAAAVALARVAGKKHHPRDVAAGALIGGGAIWLSLKIRLALERRMLGHS